MPNLARDTQKRFVFLPAIAFVGAVLVAACGSSDDTSSTSTSDGGKSDGSTFDGGGGPCDGLGCASMPGAVEIRVLTASGDPVPSPTFEASGLPLQAFCENDAGQILQDAGTCDPWTIDTLAMGPTTITVSAAGYEPATVAVTVTGPSGCCGIGPTVDASVTLTSSADAGDDGG